VLAIDVLPLDDTEALPVPREAIRGAAHWPSSVWRASDAFALARDARRLCADKLNQACAVPEEACYRIYDRCWHSKSAVPRQCF
jgi:hypothetical protein